MGKYCISPSRLRNLLTREGCGAAPYRKDGFRSQISRKQVFVINRQSSIFIVPYPAHDRPSEENSIFAEMVGSNVNDI